MNVNPQHPLFQYIRVSRIFELKDVLRALGKVGFSSWNRRLLVQCIETTYDSADDQTRSLIVSAFNTVIPRYGAPAAPVPAAAPRVVQPPGSRFPPSAPSLPMRGPVHHGSVNGASSMSATQQRHHQDNPHPSPLSIAHVALEDPLVSRCEVLKSKWVRSIETKVSLYPVTLAEGEKLVLRFVLVEDGAVKFPTRWPAHLRIRLDPGGNVLFDTTHGSLFPNSDASDDPPPAVDLTQRVQAGATQATVTFRQIASGSTKRWLLCYMRVMAKPVETMLEAVRLKSPSAAECEQRVRTLMQGEDEGVACAVQEVSLKDPLVLARIVRAGRGVECKHLQCFDVGVFLRMQQAAKVSCWACPVCKKALPLADVVFDAWFQAMCDHGSSTSVRIVRNDSTWEVPPGPEDDDIEQDDDDDPVVALPAKRAKVAVQAVLPRNLGSSNAPIELLDSDDELF